MRNSIQRYWERYFDIPHYSGSKDQLNCLIVELLIEILAELRLKK